MYQLAPHVYACTTGRNCMFLDLQRDRYLSVPQVLMDELAPQIHDWHLPTHVQRPTGLPQGDVTLLIKDLLEAGILCSYRAEPLLRPPDPPAASRDFTSVSCPTTETETPFHCVSAFATLLTADIALRLRPLSQIIRRICAHPLSGRTDDRREHLHSACALAKRFAAVRPWYPRDYLCLFDSLALRLFLLRHGIGARWIFGVREDPFAAHCWVQCGSVVLNEYLDRTRLYTPIMTV